MLIAQISDTHIAAPGQKTCGVAPMAENLARCVARINALDPKPDIVLLSGDIANNAGYAETEHAASLLSALQMPLYVVPGNHDDRTTLAKVFGPDVCPANEAGLVNYVVDGFPLRIIALDTLDPGKPGGKLEHATLDWLRARLDEAPEQPTLLCAHHPPLNLGIPETDVDGFAGKEVLGEIVSANPNIETFVCGHIHLHTNTRWCGTLVTTAPSIGMQLEPGLEPEGTSRFLLSEPAYLLHDWTLDRHLVTHLVSLAKLPGPFDFSS